ncbi:MAG: CAP domain-containing protein [Marinosulfonomonas sp.]|nr:CAP domain-containing protein [Marinosulfonomonas sp.]
MKLFHLGAVLIAVCFTFVGSGASAARCAVPANVAEMAALAGQLINNERSKSGRKSLSVNSKLQASAQAHACDMSVKGYFSHVGKDGSKPKRRLQRQGCRAGLVAENIAVGQTSPQDLMSGWMSSPGHRKNILLGRGVKQYGIGIANAGKAYTHGYLWVLVVARGC